MGESAVDAVRRIIIETTEAGGSPSTSEEIIGRETGALWRAVGELAKRIDAIADNG